MLSEGGARNDLCCGPGLVRLRLPLLDLDNPLNTGYIVRMKFKASSNPTKDFAPKVPGAVKTVSDGGFLTKTIRATHIEWHVNVESFEDVQRIVEQTGSAVQLMFPRKYWDVDPTPVPTLHVDSKAEVTPAWPLAAVIPLRSEASETDTFAAHAKVYHWKDDLIAKFDALHARISKHLDTPLRMTVENWSEIRMTTVRVEDGVERVRSLTKEARYVYTPGKGSHEWTAEDFQNFEKLCIEELS